MVQMGDLVWHFSELVVCVSVGIRSAVYPRSPCPPPRAGSLGADFWHAVVYYQRLLCPCEPRSEAVPDPCLARHLPFTGLRIDFLFPRSLRVRVSSGLFAHRVRRSLYRCRSACDPAECAACRTGSATIWEARKCWSTSGSVGVYGGQHGVVHLLP